MARRKAVAVEPATPREVREWANDNGHEVGVKGRIAKSVKEAFTEATGRPIV